MPRTEPRSCFLIQTELR